MMTCKYGSIDDYLDSTYEELLDVRKDVMADIIAFEEEKEIEENWYKKPGADYDYWLNLVFLGNLINAIAWKFHRENDDMLRAISKGEFKAEASEGRASQVKRYTRWVKENALDDEKETIEFAINKNGAVDAFISGKHAGTIVDVYATSEYEFGDELNSNEKYLLLEAECHYRKYIGAGSLRKTIWEIYSDGSYQIKHIYNLNWDEMERANGDEANAGKEKTLSGVMDEDQFQKLQEAIGKDIWRNATVRRSTRDDNEWMIYMYDAKGKTVKDSGALSNIRGNKNLEAIASCLPPDSDI